MHTKSRTMRHISALAAAAFAMASLSSLTLPVAAADNVNTESIVAESTAFEPFNEASYGTMYSTDSYPFGELKLTKTAAIPMSDGQADEIVSETKNVAAYHWNIDKYDSGVVSIKVNLYINCVALTTNLAANYPDAEPVYFYELMHVTDFASFINANDSNISKVGRLVFNNSEFQSHIRTFEEDTAGLYSQLNVLLPTFVMNEIYHDNFVAGDNVSGYTLEYLCSPENMMSMCTAAATSGGDYLEIPLAEIVLQERDITYDGQMLILEDMQTDRLFVQELRTMEAVPDVTSLQTELDTITQDYLTLQADKAVLDTEYTALLEKYNTLVDASAADATAAAEKIAELEANISEKDATITTLNNRITELTAQIEELKSDTKTTVTGSADTNNNGYGSTGSGGSNVSSGNKNDNVTSAGNSGNGTSTGSVSTNGTASTGNASTNNDTSSAPKTGDNGIAAPLAVLVAAAGVCVLSRKPLRIKHED